MRYGVTIPFDIDALVLADLAREAEEAGWDGVFYWDDGRALIGLTVAAMHTRRILLGTFVTPLPRYQPWQVASEVVALEHIAQGRVVLPVGLGVVEFERMGIPKDYKTRARMLDEGLEVIDGLWSGEAFAHEGEFYHVEETQGFQTLQRPRVPIWVVGGEKKSQVRRAARWDGVIIPGSAQEVKSRLSEIMPLRKSEKPLEVVTEGQTPGDDLDRAREIVTSFAQAGVTWWNEGVWQLFVDGKGVEGMRTRIRQGPPRM
jgi:alkanesulfonate monooxygenase SsuD/methylene tetrahydromethanopterin reductase-like flavin-dependent oxidoreductase (luciferase family)